MLDSHPGDFRQADVFTALARRARSGEMDRAPPTDADEFLWLRRGVSLASLCGPDDIGGYRLPVCNFLQARPVRRDWFGSLLTMCVAAMPFGSVADGEVKVGSGEIPFVRITYPSKLLLRTAASLEITFGNHGAAQHRRPASRVGRRTGPACADTFP